MMLPHFTDLDRRLSKLTRVRLLAVAICAVFLVGSIDFLTGYEVSMSLFYLLPVAIATWYSGRSSGISIALISCISWYLAEIVAGHHYSHPAIPVWNAFVRLGFFLITCFLMSALRNNLDSHRFQARTDSLTGLCTRRVFEECLRLDLALARRLRSPVTIAYVDLDNFKAVNDSAGHAEGDRVLRAIGKVLSEFVREADTAARLGGDEFALLLPDTNHLGARHFIDKLDIELKKVIDANAWDIGCSIGVTTFLDAAVTPEQAIASADGLMYDVKRKGKGDVAFSVFGEEVLPRSHESSNH